MHGKQRTKVSANHKRYHNNENILCIDVAFLVIIERRRCRNGQHHHAQTCALRLVLAHAHEHNQSRNNYCAAAQAERSAKKSAD